MNVLEYEEELLDMIDPDTPLEVTLGEYTLTAEEEHFAKLGILLALQVLDKYKEK